MWEGKMRAHSAPLILFFFVDSLGAKISISMHILRGHSTFFLFLFLFFFFFFCYLILVFLNSYNFIHLLIFSEFLDLFVCFFFFMAPFLEIPEPCNGCMDIKAINNKV